MYIGTSSPMPKQLLYAPFLYSYHQKLLNENNIFPNKLINIIEIFAVKNGILKLI